MNGALNHVLLTGASSGIGSALARYYAAPGRRLSLGGRDAARLEETVAECRRRGAAALAERHDVLDRAAMRAWIAARDAEAPLDLVIANAGVAAGSGGARETEEDARRVLAVNLEGVLNTAFPAIDCMRRRGRGHLALVSSLAGYRGFPDAPAYSASKAAVKSLGEAWRGTLAASGIRVFVVCPGFVTTPMTAGNRFPMPFLMTAERAAAVIAQGLAADRPRISFPWPMALIAWFITALPVRLGDRLLRPRESRRR